MYNPALLLHTLATSEVKLNCIMVVSLDRWVGKTAIVTGASAGIGAAIAVALVEAGINVSDIHIRYKIILVDAINEYIVCYSIYMTNA